MIRRMIRRNDKKSKLTLYSWYIQNMILNVMQKVYLYISALRLR